MIAVVVVIIVVVHFKINIIIGVISPLLLLVFFVVDSCSIRASFIRFRHGVVFVLVVNVTCSREYVFGTVTTITVLLPTTTGDSAPYVVGIRGGNPSFCFDVCECGVYGSNDKVRTSDDR